MTWQPDICIYHKHCNDGFASAWAVWRRWGDVVDYVPMQYGDPLPNIAGHNVLMVDFSLKREAMLEAAAKAASIVVLDHHKTAEEELEPWAPPLALDAPLSDPTGDLPFIFADYAERKREPIVAVFDMDKSGCRLTWEFCHPDKPIPRLLEHIEDRDLWRYKIRYTREIAAAVSSWDYDFQRFDEWARNPECLERLIWAGGAILRVDGKRISDWVQGAYIAEVEGYRVPVVNVPGQFASDTGHELLKRFPDAPFAAVWFQPSAKEIVWSLRSEEGREDVGRIAATVEGGGGHRHAAGFRKAVGA